MTEFSKYVYAMGRGPSKGRNLTREEASAAMTQILSGSVAPEAVGALLMLMRYRGETPREIAGFIDAMRMRMSDWSDLNVDLDWPSYAAGRTRGLPWFLLAAKIVGMAGFPVMLHGWNSHQNSIADVASAVNVLNIPVCNTPQDAKAALYASSVIYCPLAGLDSDVLKLLKLRDVLGLRSAVNTALRGLNPSGAKSSVQGVFHPSYRDLQAHSAELLGQGSMVVIKGGGGEFECNPSKDTQVFKMYNNIQSDFTVPAVLNETMRLSDASDSPSDLVGLWNGDVENRFAEQSILTTAAIALHACDTNFEMARSREIAETLWAERTPIHQNL